MKTNAISYLAFLFAVVFLTPLAALRGAEPKDPAPAPFTPAADLRGEWAMQVDAKLPNVLILGDSISIGYTRDVRKLLIGKANVFRPMRAGGRSPDNCGDTTIGLANIDRWLGTTHWDLIHFNWGLWDLCYRNPASKEQGNRDKVNGKLSTPPADYERNLEQLVTRLKATGAKLIWASTTTVPEGEVGRFVGDEIKYNAIAARVMARHQIPINDLQATTRTLPPAMFTKPGDVHFTSVGYAKLAAQVAAQVSEVLEARPGIKQTAVDPGKRPNILFLFADDWGYPAASCLGCPVVKTPAFDRIAKEGVLFRNAHTAAPSCSPSRAAILTGQWPWRLEQGANLHGFIPTKFATYTDLMETTGYFVGLTKKGYAPGSNEGRPHNAAGPAFKDFDAFLAARPQGKPFCYWYGSYDPHRPYQPGIGKRSGIDPAKVFVPPYLPDNATTRGDISDYLHQVQLFDQQCGDILQTLEKSGELENTLIVITGDNGWPFPRSKITCYDSGTHQPLAIRWGSRIKGGRTVDDFVSLSDLAPTFLEAAGQPIPGSMTARSLMPILLSDKSGQIDPTRDHTLTGMERHARSGRSDGERRSVGYPMRTLITKDFHYIRNFKPDRWPAGDPPKLPLPGFESIVTNTSAAFPDCDQGPTKAFMILHRDEAAVKPFADLAFGKRPDRELYDLRQDPFEMKNVAGEPDYANTVRELDARLMAELKATGDPRVSGGGDEFENYPPAVPKKSR